MPTNNPAISVVMSVYNSEKYLAEAIESILNQTFTDFEFIIINDGSTDSSLAIIESYMAKDERVVLISRENKGLPASLNEGIAIAKGKYIARMDADDISLPERFDSQFSYLEKNNNIDVLGTNAFQIDKNGRKKKRLFLFSKKFLLSTKDNHLKANLIFSSCFIHPTVMIRKSTLNNFQALYDPGLKVSQDYELWCRLAPIATFANLRVPLLKYRVNDQGITNSCSSVDKDKNISNIIESYMSGFSCFNLGIHLGISRLNKNNICKYHLRDLIYYLYCLIRYTSKRFNVYGTSFLYFRIYATLKIAFICKLSSFLGKNNEEH